jgi:hypothetical protein
MLEPAAAGSPSGQAQRVGSDGTVFAEDINPEAIKAINDRFSGTGV